MHLQEASFNKIDFDKHLQFTSSRYIFKKKRKSMLYGQEVLNHYT